MADFRIYCLCCTFLCLHGDHNCYCGCTKYVKVTSLKWTLCYVFQNVCDSESEDRLACYAVCFCENTKTPVMDSLCSGFGQVFLVSKTFRTLLLLVI